MNSDPTSLDRLHDIILPPNAPWWPPAPGWYWVLALAVIVVLTFAFRFFLYWQRNCYRREALSELAQLEAVLGDPAQSSAAVTAFAELLKRAALSAWPRESVASLTGSVWLAFLDRTGNTNSFSEGPGALIEQVAYDQRLADGMSETQLRALAALVRGWLRHHRIQTIRGEQR
ncbi:MAG: DUF4381 domain-containing protein [Chthoniobacterales bacterium]